MCKGSEITMTSSCLTQLLEGRLQWHYDFQNYEEKLSLAWNIITSQTVNMVGR